MKIRFLTSMAGQYWSIQRGEEVDWPDATARAQIAAGNAESVEPAADTAPAPRRPRR